MTATNESLFARKLRAGAAAGGRHLYTDEKRLAAFKSAVGERFAVKAQLGQTEIRQGFRPDRLPKRPFWHRFKVGSHAPVLVALDEPLILAAADRLLSRPFAGEGAAPTGVDAQLASQTAGLFAAFAVTVLTGAEAAAPVVCEQVTADPDLLAIEDPTMALAAVEIAGVDLGLGFAASVFVALPAASSTAPSQDARGQDRPSDRAAAARQAGDVSVECLAIVGRIEIPLADLLSLAPGSAFALSTPEDGRTKLVARAALNLGPLIDGELVDVGGRRAVRIDRGDNSRNW